MAGVLLSSPVSGSVKFDFTPDELVDVNLRIVRATRTTQAARRQYQWASALGGAAALTGAGLLSVGVTTASVVATATSGLVLGAVCFALSGKVFDDRQRRWVRRAVDEHLAKFRDRSVELELREDGLRCRQTESEMTFFWKNVRTIAEQAGDIEFRFNSGLVVARQRAFACEEERRAFIAAARRLAVAAGATL